MNTTSTSFLTIVAAAFVGCSTLSPLPAALDPGPATRLLGTLSATGVQVYECRAATVGAVPSWTFVAPEAELFDDKGQRVGDHGAGPYWALTDGSRIVGSVRGRADAPRADAIPWLLLETRSTGTAGRLAAVHRVQRVKTDGGLAPATGCDVTRVGALARVPYRADYRLFVHE
jgi:Protein of unknown function (DUF3455)